MARDHHQLHAWLVRGGGKVTHPPASGPSSLTLTMRLVTGMLQELRDNTESVFAVRRQS